MSNKTMLCAGLLTVWKRPFEWPQRADCCQFSLPPLMRQPEILNLDSCQSRPAGSGRLLPDWTEFPELTRSCLWRPAGIGQPDQVG